MTKLTKGSKKFKECWNWSIYSVCLFHIKERVHHEHVLWFRPINLHFILIDMSLPLNCNITCSMYSLHCTSALCLSVWNGYFYQKWNLINCSTVESRFNSPWYPEECYWRQGGVIIFKLTNRRTLVAREPKMNTVVR